MVIRERIVLLFTAFVMFFLAILFSSPLCSQINDQLLVEKFCPSLKLNSGDSGVSPEPIEIVSHTLYLRRYDILGEYADTLVYSTAGMNYSHWKSGLKMMGGTKYFVIPHFKESAYWELKRLRSLKYFFLGRPKVTFRLWTDHPPPFLISAA